MRTGVCGGVRDLQLPGAPPRVREEQMVPLGVVKACARSQRCSSLPSSRYITLRYINSVKGNSFQRRVCLCSFSRDCEGNTARVTLLCMCACLSGSCSLQCTRELKMQIFLQRKFGLQGEGEGIGTNPSFIFSIATEQQ